MARPSTSGAPSRCPRFFAHVAISRQRIQDRTYSRDKDGKFSSTGGGAGSGTDITGNEEALQDIFAATTDEDGHWKNNDRDMALIGIAERQGFDRAPTTVPAAEFDAYVRDGGHTALHRGVKANEETGDSAADIHAEVRDGPYRPGLGMFGNGFYTAPDADKARPFSDGTPGSLGRYALHRDARTITYSELRDRYDREVYPHYKTSSVASQSILADFGRYAAALGFDAIHVPAGTPMMGGGKVGRDEYVVLNRGALIAEAP